MIEDVGRSYERGLAYLGAARKLLLVARQLDDDDREHLRRTADGLVSKGTDLLTSVVKPRKGRRQAAPEGDTGSAPE